VSRPLVVFGDAAAAGATALRDALTGRSEPYAADATVGTRVPDLRSPEDPRLPFILIAEDDADPHPARINAAVLLRITVWHRDRDQAHDLAQLAAGLLNIHSGPVIRSTRSGSGYGTGPHHAIDSDSEVDLSTFTLTANIRPIQLTP
jgi:hypothetical protein